MDFYNETYNLSLLLEEDFKIIDTNQVKIGDYSIKRQECWFVFNNKRYETLKTALIELVEYNEQIK